MKNWLKSLLNNRLFALLAFVALSLSANAAPADATGILDAASDAFDAVSVLVVAMVSFFIIVRIVKGIRK